MTQQEIDYIKELARKLEKTYRMGDTWTALDEFNNSINELKPSNDWHSVNDGSMMPMQGNIYSKMVLVTDGIHYGLSQRNMADGTWNPEFVTPITHWKVVELPTK